MGVFYFRIAGATYHHAADELDGDAFSEVILRHRPDNPHDPNAIEILNEHGMGLVGFVPAKLAPEDAPRLDDHHDQRRDNDRHDGTRCEDVHSGRASGRWRGAHRHQGH